MKVKMSIRIALAAALALPHAARADEPGVLPETPVMMLGGHDTDPCGNGHVSSAPGEGDSDLTVHSAPEANAAGIGALYKGQVLYVCQEKGDWLGIVYTDDSKKNCNTTTPWKETAPYTGPCSSGWVERKYVEITAG